MNKIFNYYFKKSPPPLLRARAAFTVFEIMVIVAIIGLLLAIALPNYLEARRKAEKNICTSNQKMIYTAAAMYITRESSSLEDINGNGARLQELVDKGYLRGNRWCECPASKDKDYDDYIMIFEDGFISDIECDEKGSLHEWP